MAFSTWGPRVYPCLFDVLDVTYLWLKTLEFLPLRCIKKTHTIPEIIILFLGWKTTRTYVVRPCPAKARLRRGGPPRPRPHPSAPPPWTSATAWRRRSRRKCHERTDGATATATTWATPAWSVSDAGKSRPEQIYRFAHFLHTFFAHFYTGFYLESNYINYWKAVLYI